MDQAFWGAWRENSGQTWERTAEWKVQMNPLCLLCFSYQICAGSNSKAAPTPVLTQCWMKRASALLSFCPRMSKKKKKKWDSSVELLCVCNGSIQSFVFLKPRFLSAMWSYRFTFCFHAWSISFLFKILNDVALTYNWHYMKWLSLCIWHYNYNICAYM